MRVEPFRYHRRGDSRCGLDAQHRVRLVVGGHRVDYGQYPQHARLAHAGDAVPDGPARYAELLRDDVIGRSPVVLE